MANYNYPMYVSENQEFVTELLEEIDVCGKNENCSDCDVDDKCNLCDTDGQICHTGDAGKVGCCAGSKLYSMNFWQLLMNVEKSE